MVKIVYERESVREKKRVKYKKYRVRKKCAL